MDGIRVSTHIESMTDDAGRSWVKITVTSGIISTSFVIPTDQFPTWLEYMREDGEKVCSKSSRQIAQLVVP